MTALRRLAWPLSRYGRENRRLSRQARLYLGRGLP